MKHRLISGLLLSLLMVWADAFAQNSPHNPFSQVSPYPSVGQNSPFNPLATDPPKIYGSDGTYYGEWTTNNLRPDAITNPIGRYGNPVSPDSLTNPFGNHLYQYDQVPVWDGGLN